MNRRQKKKELNKMEERLSFFNDNLFFYYNPRACGKTLMNMNRTKIIFKIIVNKSYKEFKQIKKIYKLRRVM